MTSQLYSCLRFLRKWRRRDGRRCEGPVERWRNPAGNLAGPAGYFSTACSRGSRGRWCRWCRWCRNLSRFFCDFTSSHLFTSLHISDPGWVNHFNCLVLDCWWIMTTAFLSTIPSLCGETSHGHSALFHTINALCPTSKQRGEGTVFALQTCPMQGTYEPNLTKTKNHEFRHRRNFLVSIICVYVGGGLGWWFGSLGIDGFVKLDQNYQTL